MYHTKWKRSSQTCW